jgi:hypothetical protein
MKFKAPCWVTLAGSAEPLRLRRVSAANKEMKRRGWKGLVAHIQNEKGTGLVEYRKLRACPAIH